MRPNSDRDQRYQKKKIFFHADISPLSFLRSHYNNRGADHEKHRYWKQRA